MKRILMQIIIVLSIFFSGVTFLHAQSYYVHPTDGKDTNSGEDEQLPWKTIARVNRSLFKPGDIIKFACNGVWGEQLTVPTSGTFEKPIIFTKYGNGANPLIKSTERFSNWKDEGPGLWSGQLPDPSITNHYGILTKLDGIWIRNSRYWHYTADSYYQVPSDLKEMKIGFFYAPYNKRIFYYKTSGENPGTVEIASRPYSIYMSGKHDIIIDGININGPHGGVNNLGTGGRTAGIRIVHSANITIKNLSVKYSSSQAISFYGSGTKNTVIENVNIDNSKLGIYYTRGGNTHLIQDSRITNIGTVIPENSDRDFIGILDTDYVTIKNCYMEHQGWENVDVFIDAGVTFAAGSDYGKVLDCYIKDSAEGGIVMGEGKNFEISGNIIDGWGKRPGISHNHFDGITVGGGSKKLTNPRNVKIHNNLFINGGENLSSSTGIKVNNYDAAGLEIRDNIFLNNNVAYELWYEPENTKGWKIENNIFFSNKNKNIINYARFEYFNKTGMSADGVKYNGYKNYISGNIFADPKIKFSNGQYSFSKNSPYYGSGIGPLKLSDNNNILLSAPNIIGIR